MTTQSAADDAIYIMLVDARKMLLQNFETAKELYGEPVYSVVMEKLQEEHDALLAKIDERINKHIMDLAVQELGE